MSAPKETFPSAPTREEFWNLLETTLIDVIADIECGHQTETETLDALRKLYDYATDVHSSPPVAVSDDSLTRILTKIADDFCQTPGEIEHKYMIHYGGRKLLSELTSTKTQPRDLWVSFLPRGKDE